MAKSDNSNAMEAPDFETRLANLERAHASLQDRVMSFDVNGRAPEQAFVTPDGFHETVAQMKAFLSKYAFHERPAAPLITTVVRDREGFFRNERGEVVPYQSDAAGVLLDKQGNKLNVVDTFPLQGADWPDRSPGISHDAT